MQPEINWHREAPAVSVSSSEWLLSDSQCCPPSNVPAPSVPLQAHFRFKKSWYAGLVVRGHACVHPDYNVVGSEPACDVIIVGTLGLNLKLSELF